MARIRIADLLENPLVDPVAHLDAERVERYARNLDELPSVVVFDTGSGLLLADGYHRVAAARRMGARTIDADIRQGSREAALRYAVDVGAVQHGVPADDALARIRARSQGRWPEDP